MNSTLPEITGDCERMSTEAGQAQVGKAASARPASSIRVRPWSPAVRALVAVVVLALAAGLRVTAHAWQRGPQRSTRLAIVLKVDPNTVPAHVLEALPHVGPALSGRMIAERDMRAFDSLAELRRRVRGLGPATMARLSRHLVIRDGARPSAKPVQTTIASTPNGR